MAGLPDTVTELVKQLGLIEHPEGGFFRETFRSGVVGDSMRCRGQTDLSVAAKDLVRTIGRENCRPDQDARRHGLTSIYWVATPSSPNLKLCINHSPHVHYYHGGLPFEYILYNPDTRTLDRIILGPNLQQGHVLQVPVDSGIWKAGRLLTDYADKPDYTLIGEGVGPGFDFHDLRLVSRDEMSQVSEEHRKVLQPFFHSEDLDFDSTYD